MNSSNIEAVVDLINESGIKICTYASVQGGINSQVYKLIDSEGNAYALKLYPRPTPFNSFNRYQAEINFIQLLRDFDVNCCPKIVFSGQRYNWVLLEWLEGRKISALSHDDIRQVCNFIIKINSNQFRYKAASKLTFASEAISSSDSVRLYLNKRMKRLLSVDLYSPLQKEIAKWISLVFLPRLQQELKLFSIASNQKYWNDCNIGTFVSPSDIGIHNILNVEGKLHFIDFEYSGIDDISKLVADLIVHPEYAFTKSDQKCLYSFMLSNWNEFRNIEFERCRSMHSLQALKWTIILLNKFRDNTISETSWLKVKTYYHQYFDA